jgi:23S rRNA (uracil1939-C5)-methyltransferase
MDGYESTVAGTKDVVIEGGDGQPLVTPAASFSQVNSHINRELCRVVAEWMDEKGCKRVLELFAGAGNLTAVMARAGSRVTAVEIDSAACLALRKNIDARKLSGVTARADDALGAFLSAEDKYDLVVLDPPRGGDVELAKAISRCKIGAVLYISCNPATLSRDIAQLARGGYKMKKAVGFDMFPNTAHTEVAVLLER